MATSTSKGPVRVAVIVAFVAGAAINQRKARTRSIRLMTSSGAKRRAAPPSNSTMVVIGTTGKRSDMSSQPEGCRKKQWSRTNGMVDVSTDSVCCHDDAAGGGEPPEPAVRDGTAVTAAATDVDASL